MKSSCLLAITVAIFSTHFSPTIGSKWNLKLMADPLGLEPSQKYGEELKSKLFQSCLEQHGVPSDFLILRNLTSKVYNDMTITWNKYFVRTQPLGYFLPISTSQVQSAIQCGVETNISLSVKSGGHGYEPYGFGTDSIITIDFRNMDNIVIEHDNEIARIEPGASLGVIDMKLWIEGGFGIPSGICGLVGIGGHALGGGIGSFTNLFGLTLDNVIEHEFVDATGQVHLASAEQNPDLFWALRGVGPGYIGIVTSFKFKLHKVDQIKFTIIELNFEKTDFTRVFVSWEKWIMTTQVKTKSYSSFSVTGGRNNLNGIKLSIRFIFSGKVGYDDTQSLTLVLEEFSGMYTSWKIMQEMSYIDVKGYRGFPKFKFNYTNTNGLEEYKKLIDKERNKEIVFHKTFQFYVNQIFNQSQMSKVEKIILQAPESSFLQLYSYTGVTSSIASNTTSFVHRNPLYHAEIIALGITRDVFEQGLAWARKVREELKFMDNGETYQNFLDDEMDDYLQRYYGSNLPKMIQSKKKWDPNNYFTNKQSIPLSL